MWYYTDSVLFDTMVYKNLLVASRPSSIEHITDPNQLSETKSAASKPSSSSIEQIANQPSEAAEPSFERITDHVSAIGTVTIPVGTQVLTDDPFQSLKLHMSNVTPDF